MKNQAAQVQKEVIEDIHANTIDRAFSFLAISVAASDIYASSVLVSCHCLSFLDLLFNSRPNVSLFIYCLHIVLAFCLTKGWVLLVYMGPAFYHPELHNSHSQSSQWLPISLEL